jgi:hypothetical protein
MTSSLVPRCHLYSPPNTFNWSPSQDQARIVAVFWKPSIDPSSPFVMFSDDIPSNWHVAAIASGCNLKSLFCDDGKYFYCATKHRWRNWHCVTLDPNPFSHARLEKVVNGKQKTAARNDKVCFRKDIFGQIMINVCTQMISEVRPEHLTLSFRLLDVSRW